MRGRVLLVLLMCLVLALGGGCSSDPECLAAPYLPQCFDDDDEEKPADTAPQTRVRAPAHAEDIDTTMAALGQSRVGTALTTVAAQHRHLTERGRSLHGRRYNVVDRGDGGHRHLDGVHQARRSSLEARSAVGERLDAVVLQEPSGI
jgi:hypothetical protein